jgi:chaperone modulatory protein CbpM
MLEAREFARVLHIDTRRLRYFVDKGWVVPLVPDGKPLFRDIDLARAALIVDLIDDMGVNDEGVDLALDLIDQLYGLRVAFGNLLDALEVQPRGVRLHLVNDARKLDILARRGSRSAG